MSCIYAGMIAGPAMISYARNNMKAKGDVPASLLAAGKKLASLVRGTPGAS